MERPTSILGLTTYLVRQRWSALGQRARIAVVVIGALGAMAGAKLAMGCGSSCGSCCAASGAAASSSP
jgi:hypothetical protein